MKILFVLEHYYPYIGGAEQLFQSLAEVLAKKGNQVTVLTSHYERKLPKKETYHQVNIIRIPARNRFSFTFLALPYLIRMIKSFEIIHTTTYTAALPTWIACKLFHKKCFLTFHEYWGNLWKKLPFLSWVESRLFYLFEQIIFKLPFYKIIAVSDFTKNKLIQNDKKSDNIIRIYNGLDYADFNNKRDTKPSQFTCTYFGRLGVSKGLDLLIPAISIHIKNHPDSVFNLVLPKTPKKMYQKINSLIQRYAIQSNIQLFHHLEKKDLNTLIRNSSSVIIPSYSEGFCFAAVEAIAMGTPIIHSNLGALKETVSGKHIIIEKMDIEHVAIAIAKAQQDNWDVREAKEFHLNDAIGAYLELYGSSGSV